MKSSQVESIRQVQFHMIWYCIKDGAIEQLRPESFYTVPTQSLKQNNELKHVGIYVISVTNLVWYPELNSLFVTNVQRKPLTKLGSIRSCSAC